MAVINLQKSSGKWSKIREKSRNLEVDNEWQPYIYALLDLNNHIS